MNRALGISTKGQDIDHCQQLEAPLSSPPRVACLLKSLLGLQVTFTCYWTFYQNTCSLSFCLTSFAQCYMWEVHSCFAFRSNLFFLIVRSCFIWWEGHIYLSISLLMDICFVLFSFPVFGYYEKQCSEHSYMSFGVGRNLGCVLWVE